MAKLWVVAKREFLVNVRRPGFLFGVFGLPLLMGGLLLLVFTVAAEAESDIERVGVVGYVDEAEILDEEVEVPENFTQFEDEAAARAAYEANAVGAYFVLPPDYLGTGTVRVYSDTETPEALSDTIRAYIVANLGAQLDDVALVERLQEPVDLTIRALDSNRTVEGAAVAGLFFTPFLFVMVLLLASQISSSYLMSGIVEEKTNRVIEMLITSVTPFQLLAGKILGLALLGLVQLGVWIGAAWLVLTLGQGLDFLAGVSLPPDLVAIGVVYFILTYLLFASVMAGIGAVVGSEQESRQYAGFLGFFLAIPFFFIVTFITDPNGPISIVLTLVPITSSITVMMRLGFSTLPTWQLVASLAILTLTTLLAMWASGRVFRWALLQYGKRPNLSQLLRVVRRPRADMATQETAQ